MFTGDSSYDKDGSANSAASAGTHDLNESSKSLKSKQERNHQEIILNEKLTMETLERIGDFRLEKEAMIVEEERLLLQRLFLNRRTSDGGKVLVKRVGYSLQKEREHSLMERQRLMVEREKEADEEMERLGLEKVRLEMEGGMLRFHHNRSNQTSGLLTERDPCLPHGIIAKVAEYCSAKDQLSIRLLSKAVKGALPKRFLLNLKYVKKNLYRFVKIQSKLPVKERRLEVGFKLNPIVVERQPFSVLAFISKNLILVFKNSTHADPLISIGENVFFKQCPVLLGAALQDCVMNVLQRPHHHHQKFSLMILPIAAYANCLPALNFLLLPANRSEIITEAYQVALCFACGNDSFEALKILLDLPDSRVFHTSIMSIPFAASLGSARCVKLLLQDRRLNPGDNGNTAIFLAAQRGNMEIFLLFYHDKRVDPSGSICGAAAGGNLEILTMLLNNPRVDPAVDDNLSIKWASLQGNTAMVRLFLADPRVDASAGNNQALRWARGKGHLEVVALLEEHLTSRGLSKTKFLRSVMPKMLTSLYI